MDAIVFYPKDEKQFRDLKIFADQSEIDNTWIDEGEKKKLAGIILASLSKKNPKANATMEEIISVVEEVRTEYFYGKKNNNS